MNIENEVTPEIEDVPETEVIAEQEPEDTRNHATLVADVERIRKNGHAFTTLIGVDLNRLSPADLRALEVQALAEKAVGLATRAENADREAALYAATHLTREQVQARAEERVINLRARHRAQAIQNDQLAHHLRHRVETPEPPMAA